MPKPTTKAYLDYNATAPMREETVAVIAQAMREVGNPSSTHQAGQGARRRLEAARSALAALVAVDPTAVIFTSGATESNHAALAAVDGKRLVSAIEHPSVAAVDASCPPIPVTPDGVINLDALERMLRSYRPELVAVMAANNETGVVQPVGAIARLVHEAGALLHVDAVQAITKLPLCVGGVDGADSLSISGHKLGGPPGIGALILAPGRRIRPWLRGGGQEGRRRAGTENVPSAVGWAHALASSVDWNAIALLRKRLEKEVRLLCPEARIVGEEAPRLPNTTCLITPGISNEAQLMALDLAGVSIGTGSACSSGKVEPSMVLQAMGVGADDARSAIRISLGWASCERDIDAFLSVYESMVGVRRRRMGLSSGA
ncbi:cysteine desulfurase [Arboricoccus pini]|uniref:Cysteine desulfurase n=1 Tax=Arboricoccus pini TaxID=1963835 RepID=A0A212R5F9_9PROT|nr:cysteine desulfurase family protein [Arboricoccus pini]SNB67289.1 cysteine desulfurase [Arboricoccus pini]